MSEDTEEPRRALRPRPGAPKKGKGPESPAAKPAAGAAPAKHAAPAPVAAHKGAASKKAAKSVPDADALDPPEARKALPPPTPDMSKDELARQYMGYVRSIAGNVWKTLSKDIEFDDLVSYGMLGLFEAAERYDAKFGANFMTFAYYRIRGAIYDGLRGMGWVSRTEYQTFRAEQRANAYLQNVQEREMIPVNGPVKTTDDDEVNQLADVVGGLVTIYVTALDAMEGFQVKDENATPADESLEQLQSQELVKQAVEKLPDKEKQLIELYYYKELSLEEVGKHLQLSKSWTSRLHARAVDKLSRLLKDLIDERRVHTAPARV